MRRRYRLRPGRDDGPARFEPQRADGFLEYFDESPGRNAVHANAIERLCFRSQNVEVDVAERQALTGIRVINPPPLGFFLRWRRSTLIYVLIAAVDRNEMLVQQGNYMLI